MNLAQIGSAPDLDGLLRSQDIRFNLRKKLNADERKSKEGLALRKDLGLGYLNLANAIEVPNDSIMDAYAIVAIKSAIREFQGLLSEEKGSLRYKFQLAKSHRLLGDRFMGLVQASLSAEADAARKNEVPENEVPEKDESVSDRVDSVVKVLLQDSKAAAMESYQTAIIHTQELSLCNPDVPKYEGLLAEIHLNYGVLIHYLGQGESSEEHRRDSLGRAKTQYKKAFELFRKTRLFGTRSSATAPPRKLRAGAAFAFTI